MRRGQRVEAGEIPDPVLSTGPWVERGAIWALIVVPEEPAGLEFGVDFGRANGTYDDVLGQRVSPMLVIDLNILSGPYMTVL